MLPFLRLVPTCSKDGGPEMIAHILLVPSLAGFGSNCRIGCTQHPSSLDGPSFRREHDCICRERSPHVWCQSNSCIAGCVEHDRMATFV